MTHAQNQDGVTTIVFKDTDGRALRRELIKAAARGELPAADGRRVEAAGSLLGIELARPGKWKLASGELDVDARKLDDAARFANREGARPGYLKIGHTDTRFMAGDGEPALGWLHNIRLEEDDEGHVLLGDLHDVPDWLKEAIPRHWPDRSIEGYADYEHDGERYGLVVDGLALLGVTPPGMSSIKSLRDLPQALGLPVAASNGTRIVASFGDPQTPASAGPPPTKGAGMSLVKYREALAGLPDDASDDEVRTVLTEAGLADAQGQPVAAAAVPAGMIVLASSVWEEQQKTIKTLSAFVEQSKRNERDEVIANAIKAGKFTPAQRKQIADQWDSNPDATRGFIDLMTPNSQLSVMASGYAGEGVEADAEYAALFGAPDARKAG